jgi:hypothetical protein
MSGVGIMMSLSMDSLFRDAEALLLDLVRPKPQDTGGEGKRDKSVDIRSKSGIVIVVGPSVGESMEDAARIDATGEGFREAVEMG